MTTLVISDLHLGTHSHVFVLSRQEHRETLARAVAEADRLVVLGDLLELRETPVATALEAALPALEALGEAMAGREVVIVPGNHDHELAAPLLDELRVAGTLDALGLEHTMPAPSSGLAGRVAQALGPAKTTLAYPGIWLRDDVYATHGHYLDAHNTIPTLECLGIAATARVTGALPPGRRTPADYEAAIGPPYALTYTLAQAPGRLGKMLAGSTSRDVWKRLNGAGGERKPARARATHALSRIAFRGAVAALNRAGMGPFETDLSGVALREAGLNGIRATIDALGIEADHVVFGHTHRSGPHEGDEGWETARGARLYNTGSWIYEPAFLGTNERRSPYWPGHCVVVRETGEPELETLIT